MNRSRTILCAAALAALTAAAAAANQMQTDPLAGPHVKRLGKTVVEWKDDLIHLVVGFKHANAHLDKKWILFETAHTAEGKPLEIWREDVSLMTPDGTRLGLPSQKRMAQGIPDLRRMLNEASVQRDPIDGYFPSATRLERLGFFAIPGENLVFDKVNVNHQTLAMGDLFFESPKDRWEPGLYTLWIENKELHVRLPIPLGIEGPLERVR